MSKKNFDKNRIASYVFIAAFILALILPVVFMNFKRDQISEYENKKLADWPEFELSEDYMKSVYNYVNDRIGLWIFAKRSVWESDALKWTC